MKKTFSVILALLMLSGLFSAFAVGASADDSDAVAVTSTEEFLSMDPNGSYYLASDLLVTESYPKTFTGRFDGRGRIVTLTSEAMFDIVEDAEILDLIVHGNISRTEAGFVYDGDDYAAAVAVVANGSSTFRNIISEVNFKTTSSATKYGAIAATSAEGYDLTFENCINNGDISAVKYAGGIYGWNSKVGNITFFGCVNTGNVTADGYCAGIAARSGDASTGIHLTFKSCVNKGDITSNKEYCGGILGYTESYVHAERCVNFGNITANKGHAAGILCNLGNPESNESNHLVEFNVNYGNVKTSEKSKHAGGIIAYVYGKANAYAVVNGNVNLGVISSPGYCSQIIAYTNSNRTQITNNIGAGRVVGNDRNKALMVGLSSANIENYEISGNCFIENDGTVTYSYANDAKYASNRVALADRPFGSITFAPAEQFENGEVADMINNILVSSTFEVRGGRTTVVCRHEYPVIDGKCAACGEEQAPPVEDTAAEDTETDAPTDTTLPEETTTAPTDADGKSCGGVSVLPTFVALLCTAAAAVLKKKY